MYVHTHTHTHTHTRTHTHTHAHLVSPVPPSLCSERPGAECTLVSLVILLSLSFTTLRQGGEEREREERGGEEERGEGRGDEGRRRKTRVPNRNERESNYTPSYQGELDGLFTDSSSQTHRPGTARIATVEAL